MHEKISSINFGRAILDDPYSRSNRIMGHSLTRYPDKITKSMTSVAKANPKYRTFFRTGINFLSNARNPFWLFIILVPNSSCIIFSITASPNLVLMGKI